MLQHTEGKDITRLIANLGSHHEYVLIEEGEIVANELTVTYDEEGYKALTFTATFSDDSSITSHGMVHIMGHNPPDTPGMVKDGKVEATIPFSGYTEASSYYGYIEYRTFYSTGNTEGVLLKPIIVIDGFDPGDKRQIQDHDSSLPPDEHDSIEEMMSYIDSESVRIYLIKVLRDLGYDVIIVNHPTHTRDINGGVTIDGGADYIERNAMAHVELYERFNDTLQQNQSTEQLVIVGPSMGGQISRYALAYMEKNNMPHNTRLWVSVDSPHLGANIPVSVQTLLNVVNDNSDSVDAQDFVEKQLGSAAAKQQLIEQYKKRYIGPFVSTDVGQDYLDGRTISQGYAVDKGHPYFIQYYNDLFNNGVAGSNGYPQDGNLRKIAIVNGALTGVRNFDRPFKFKSTSYSSILIPDEYADHTEQSFRMKGYANVLGHITTMETYFMPLSGKHKTAYFKKKKFLGWHYYNRFINNNNTRGNMDNIPGGWYPSQWEMAKSVETSSSCEWAGTTSPNWGGYICVNWWDLDVLEHVNSFIPTVSALGFIDPDFNWSQKLSNNLVCTEEIPFDSYYGPKKNERHTSFTEESVEWLLAELAEEPLPPTFYPEEHELIGPDQICESSEETYSIDVCQISEIGEWSISSNLTMISSTDTTITVSENGSGEGFINYHYTNHVLKKEVWVGGPQIIYPVVCDFNGITTNCNRMCASDMTWSHINQITFHFEGHEDHQQLSEWEWVPVSGNFTLYDCCGGNTVQLSSINPGWIEFKVRAKNSCGWSEWVEHWIEVVDCGSSQSMSDPLYLYSVYPNPTNDIINVSDIGNVSTTGTVSGELFDFMGISKMNIPFNNNQASVDISSLSIGIYFLKIQYPGGEEIHQVQKN